MAPRVHGCEPERTQENEEPQDSPPALDGITNEGARQLKDFAHLKILDLAFAKITDQGLMELRECTNLERLNVNGDWRTEEAAKGLIKALPQCKVSVDVGSEHSLKNVGGGSAETDSW
jgi:hypothetical protein